uniref:Uncharacterized protein n=1 Tax=Rhizophora mucronata TaxID=61149 RepID=A0A2P2Q1T7_RHIMU
MKKSFNLLDEAQDMDHVLTSTPLFNFQHI